MAVKVKNKDGKVVTLLNPSEKGHKYAKELKYGAKVTNEGKFKVDENRKAIKLTDTQASYRSGYLAAQKDSANAYKARKAKRGK